MTENSKRLLQGMTEVRDQYILEAEAFYQEKEDPGLAKESVKKGKRQRKKKSAPKKKELIKKKRGAKYRTLRRKKYLLFLGFWEFPFP